MLSYKSHMMVIFNEVFLEGSVMVQEQRWPLQVQEWEWPLHSGWTPNTLCMHLANYSQTHFREAVVQGSYIVIKESITQITVLSVPMKLLIRNERDSYSTMKQDFILIRQFPLNAQNFLLSPQMPGIRIHRLILKLFSSSQCTSPWRFG